MGPEKDVARAACRISLWRAGESGLIVDIAIASPAGKSSDSLLNLAVMHVKSTCCVLSTDALVCSIRERIAVFSPRRETRCVRGCSASVLDIG